ncbi:hypothetical protein Hdeb2414_s0008g00279081 [Helianthus debilis subsp. tardiflorus]
MKYSMSFLATASTKILIQKRVLDNLMAYMESTQQFGNQQQPASEAKTFETFMWTQNRAMI